MKCPRCHHDVNPSDRFCAHCGYDLKKISRQPQRRRPTFQRRWLQMLPYYLIIVGCFLMPFAYTRFYRQSMLNGDTTTTVVNEIGDIKENGSTAVIARYDSADVFLMNINNGSKFIDPVNDYVDTLKTQYDVSFETEMIIWVLRNNDVVIKVDNTAQLNDHDSLCITRLFNRTKSSDTIKEVVTRTGCTDFSELTLEDQASLLTQMMGSNRYQALQKDFAKKKNSFEEDQKRIGHYGLGAYVSITDKQIVSDETTGVVFYTGDVSQVIYPDGEQFKVKVTHAYDGDGALAR